MSYFTFFKSYKITFLEILLIFLLSLVVVINNNYKINSTSSNKELEQETFFSDIYYSNNEDSININSIVNNNFNNICIQLSIITVVTIIFLTLFSLCLYNSSLNNCFLKYYNGFKLLRDLLFTIFASVILFIVFVYILNTGILDDILTFINNNEINYKILVNSIYTALIIICLFIFKVIFMKNKSI